MEDDKKKTPPPERRPLEHWASVHRPADWLLAAARAHHRWVDGQELTEEQFLDGLKAASEVQL